MRISAFTAIALSSACPVSALALPLGSPSGPNRLEPESEAAVGWRGEEEATQDGHARTLGELLRLEHRHELGGVLRLRHRHRALAPRPWRLAPPRRPLRSRDEGEMRATWTRTHQPLQPSMRSFARGDSCRQERLRRETGWRTAQRRHPHTPREDGHARPCRHFKIQSWYPLWVCSRGGCQTRSVGLSRSGRWGKEGGKGNSGVTRTRDRSAARPRPLGATCLAAGWRMCERTAVEAHPRRYPSVA
jgi:hypothetical protein